ncbi:MAG: acyltransferase family protein [Thermoguttaceae bacterium]
MAFHAGLPVPGGFVGVDVFFVISGFVITAMIQRERSSTGRFRFGRFYLRRFKRLTPALALMVAVTTVLAFCLLSPFGAQQQTAQTGLGAMLLAANFVIAMNTGDYFAPPAESNPLLHTWSLSVEEQFYLIFPAVLLLGWVLSRPGRRIPWIRARSIPWITVLVGTIALISFWLAMVRDHAFVRTPLWALHDLFGRWWDFAVSWSLGFYSPFVRSWEFAVGALLALATTNRCLRSDKHAHVLAWLGVVLLAGSAWLINNTTPFPGPWTLLPVGGTLFLIAAGTHHTTWVNRALALPAIVKIGDWSYSIYLWHWPLKVFAAALWPEARYAGTLAAVLSILPAVASYRWLEQPLRRLAPRTPRRTIALVGAVVCPAILLAATLQVAANDYWLPRYETEAVVTYQGDTGWTDFWALLGKAYYPCADRAIRDSATDEAEGTVRCWQSKPGSHIDVAIIGDSHAEHLFLGLAKALPNKNVIYYPPFGLPVRSVSGMDRIIDLVASDPAIETVIVSACWACRGVKPDELVKTLEAFKSKGKSVFVTDDVPIFGFDAVACKYRKAPILPFAQCSEDRKRLEAKYERYYPELEAAVDKVPGVRLLNTAHYFCDNDVCSMTKGKTLLFRDSNHLNNVGSSFLINQLITDSPQFRAALAQP